MIDATFTQRQAGYTACAARETAIRSQPPWTVTRTYRRTQNPEWHEYTCSAANEHIVIGRDDYLLSADGLLMRVKKAQKPVWSRN
jgi:hypothetical protein